MSDHEDEDPIEEFEREVKTRRKQLRNQGETMSAKLRHEMNNKIMNWPKRVREMKIEEFIGKYHGKVSLVKEDIYGKLHDSLREPVLQKRAPLTELTFRGPNETNTQSNHSVLYRTLNSSRRPAPPSTLRKMASETLFDEAAGNTVPATPLTKATYSRRPVGKYATYSAKRKQTAPSTVSTKQRKLDTAFPTATPAAQTRKPPASTTRRPRRNDMFTGVKTVSNNGQNMVLIETLDGAEINVSSPTTLGQLTKKQKAMAARHMATLQSTMMNLTRV